MGERLPHSLPWVSFWGWGLYPVGQSPHGECWWLVPTVPYANTHGQSWIYPKGSDMAKKIPSIVFWGRIGAGHWVLRTWEVFFCWRLVPALIYHGQGEGCGGLKAALMTKTHLLCLSHAHEKGQPKESRP